MKKSLAKTVIKTAIITFGILSLLAGTINPLTYFIGTETTASCDSVVFTPLDNGNYSIDIDYHYYANSGTRYDSSTVLEGELDESISLKLHDVKYLFFLPGNPVFITGYTIPFQSIIYALSGLIAIIAGLFIKPAKKRPVLPELSIPLPSFICPACGRDIDKDSIFCNYCGRKLIERG